MRRKSVDLLKHSRAIGQENIKKHVCITGGDTAGVAESACCQIPDRRIGFAYFSDGIDQRTGEQIGQVADTGDQIGRGDPARE